MIAIFNVETAGRFGDALADQHRLRHREFVQRQKWGVPTHNGLEFDEYDTPRAWYIARLDTSGQVIGIVRLIPTDLPYMIADLWPHLVRDIDMPHSASTWEASRLAVDSRLPSPFRERVRDEVVASLFAFGISQGMQTLIHYTPTAIVKRFLQRRGLGTEIVGPQSKEDGVPCVVCTSPGDPKRLKRFSDAMPDILPNSFIPDPGFVADMPLSLPLPPSATASRPRTPASLAHVSA